MGYPTAYRNRSGANAGLQRAWRDFPTNESGFVRFPDGRGTWGNPTKYPGQPAPFRLPPQPYQPLTPVDPATRRQQDIPWFERRTASRAAAGVEVAPFLGRAVPWALLALGIADDLWPSGPRYAYTPPPAGWTHVCGPNAYPGPPYRNVVRCFYSPTQNNFASCGLGGQSMAGLQVAPSAAIRTVLYTYGPNTALLPVERWFIFDQYTCAQALPQPSPLLSNAFNPVSLPSVAVASAPIGAWNVVPTPLPFYLVPYAENGSSPFSNARISVDVAPRPKPSPGGLQFEPNYPDVVPPIRERERKIAPEAGIAFKVFSQIGSWTSFVSALRRSLPKKYRTRNANTAQKLQDIYQHWDKMDLNAAIRSLGAFWLRYKAAGYAFGKIQQEFVRMFGPRGYQLYRGFMSYYGFNEGTLNPDAVP